MALDVLLISMCLYVCELGYVLCCYREWFCGKNNQKTLVSHANTHIHKTSTLMCVHTYSFTLLFNKSPPLIAKAKIYSSLGTSQSGATSRRLTQPKLEFYGKYSLFISNSREIFILICRKFDDFSLSKFWEIVIGFYFRFWHNPVNYLQEF